MMWSRAWDIQLGTTWIQGTAHETAWIAQWRRATHERHRGALTKTGPGEIQTLLHIGCKGRYHRRVSRNWEIWTAFWRRGLYHVRWGYHRRSKGIKGVHNWIGRTISRANGSIGGKHSSRHSTFVYLRGGHGSSSYGYFIFGSGITIKDDDGVNTNSTSRDETLILFLTYRDSISSKYCRT
jgi:hypothetical protein